MVTQWPYPQMTDLPALIDTTGWHWDVFRSPASHEFWCGIAPDGSKWIVKMRGSFYAYRERVFGGLAHLLGISCQPSALCILPPDCPPMRATPNCEPYQGANWFLNEHPPEACSLVCPRKELEAQLNNPGGDPVSVLRHSKVAFALDLARGDMMACLCGANEPSDRLLTCNHEFVMVDNERMFSSDPSSPMKCRWIERPSGQVSEHGLTLERELCFAFAGVTDSEISKLCCIPPGYHVEERWSISDKLICARDKAKKLL